MKQSTNIPTYICRKQKELDAERKFLLETETKLSHHDNQIIKTLSSYGIGVDKIKHCVGKVTPIETSTLSNASSHIFLSKVMDSIAGKAVYREEESIEEPKENLLEAIQDFKKVINARRYSEEYESAHIVDLSHIEKDLIDIELKLSNL